VRVAIAAAVRVGVGVLAMVGVLEGPAATGWG